MIDRIKIMAAVNLSFSFRTPSIVNHNSRSVEHKTLLTAFGNLSTGIPWSVLWLLRTKIREPFGLSQIFCLLVKRTGLAYQRIILHIGNWWTIGKKLPQDAIKVTMNHNSRSVEHKTLLTAFGITGRFFGSYRHLVPDKLSVLIFSSGI